jgi:hypothetical protein
VNSSNADGAADDGIEISELNGREEQYDGTLNLLQYEGNGFFRRDDIRV